MTVAFPSLSQEGQVRAGSNLRAVFARFLVFTKPFIFDRHFRAGDGLNADGLGHLRKVHRSAQVVVVGQGQRLEPQVIGAHQQVLHGGGPFLKRIVTVAMKLCVHK